MSHFIKRSLEVLKPAYYVPEKDERFHTYIQKISAQDGLKAHSLAVAQAVYTIVFAVFANAPYYLLRGTVNVLLNCVHLNFDRMVLGHYKAAMQSVLYSVIATMYVTVGIFFPSALNGFKIEVFPNSMNDWEIPDNQPFAIEPIGVYGHEMIGSYGVNLERQAYRIALNEYIRVLWEDFGIDLDNRIFAINEWLKTENYQNDPMLSALYRTLVYLTCPVDLCNLGRKRLLYTNAKEQYEIYVNSLREVIVTKQYQKMQKEHNLPTELKECLILIRALCEARFRSENHEFLRQLLQLHENACDRLHPEMGAIPAVTKENFAQVVMAKNAKVLGAPSEMKVSLSHQYSRMAYGALGLEDFLLTDLPFLRGKQVFKNAEGVERIFYYMRHPTPHIPSPTLNTIARIVSLNYIKSGETIAPEFEGMLEAIAVRKESYLIQSHQRLNDSGTCENEDGRSQTLYHLQKSHTNFHVVFQAVEGDLFDRKGPYAEITTFTGLKKAIKASFYDKKSPNRLPSLLENDELYRQEVLGNLLDQVHQILFGGRANISFNGLDLTQPGELYPNREWQEFILAFYIFQGDDLKFRLPNVKYFCTNCKNFFDRGGNRAMAEDRMHQEMSEKEVTREHLEETIVNLVPVPLQSKGKGVVQYRLRPGLALVDTLAQLSLEKRQDLQKLSFNGYKPDHFAIHKRPQQPAIPLVQDTHTFQEIKEVLKALQGKRRCLIDNAIVQKNWEPYRKEGQVALFSQVNKDLPRLNVSMDEICDDAQTKILPVKKAEGIFAHLSKTMSEEMALIAMAQIQQGIFFEPWEGLKKAFQHDELHLQVMSAAKKHMTIDIKIEADHVKVIAQCSFKYQTTNPAYSEEEPIAFFGATVFTSIPKNGAAPDGHWTWEVTDIST